MTKILESFSTAELTAASLIAVVAILLLGALAHTVMKDAGFGTILNGLLIFTGVIGGVLVRSVTLGFQ